MLDNASVDGIIRELRKRYDDRFSHYLDPHELQQFEAATSGRFSGVGLTVTGVKRGLRVASVLPDTPAQRAGIEEGDLITAVDGRSLGGRARRGLHGADQGPAGDARSSCGWSPAPAAGPATSSSSAPRCRSRSLRGRSGARAPARSPTSGTRASARGLTASSRSTLERLYRRGAEGLVLDLRGNGGGLLNEAVLSASLFLSKGELVVSTDSRTMGHRDYEAVGDPLPRHPTVVLINRDTASAAEILASALGDHHLATIVGTRSFGKGTFQEVIHLAAGGALDLTVGEYFTADGTRWPARGSSPTSGRRTIRRRRGTRGCAGRSRCWPRRWPSRTGEPAGAAGRSGRRVATFERRGRFTVAEPLFERGPQVALARGSIEVEPGEIALVDFGPGGARALRALGSAERARDVVAALLWDRGMDRGFAAALESEAGEAAAAAREAPLGAPRPRPHLATFTVDPATRARLRRRRLGRGRGRRRAALDPHRGRRRPRAARRRPRLRGASPRHEHLRARGRWSRCFPRR